MCNYIMVKLTANDIKKAKEFAALRSKDSKLYEKRGGFKLSDIITGALAEIACHKLIRKHEPELSKPDFTIYDKSQKTYKADLYTETRSFHIKGQTLQSAETYGASWLMQRRDPILNDPENGHYLVPCVVDEENKVVYVYGCVPMRTMTTEGLIGECVVPMFRTNKVCIYLSEITKKLSPNRRWSILYKGFANIN